ncbi:hypothetical protein CAPTEDRAFT_225753, partial [Capitella teleta]
MKLVLVVFLAGIALTWGSTTEFFTNLLYRSNYDKNDLPTTGTTHVKIGMYINDIVLNEEENSMKVLMYLRQSWNDPRLAHDADPKRLVPSNFIDQIWRPDTFFRNASVNVDFGCDLSQTRSAFCSIFFETYAHKKPILDYQWLDNPVQFNAGLNIPKYSLDTPNLYDCSQNYTAGSFSCLEVNLR